MELLDESDLTYLIEHIFLPPKLPQKHDPDTHRRDGVLLDYVSFISGTFLDILSKPIGGKPSVDLKVWNIVRKMLVTMGTFYNDGGIVQTKLQAALEQMELFGEPRPYFKPSLLN
jgi:hypothetical protein